MALRSHCQRLVEGAAAVGTRHLQRGEEARGLAVGKHSQELDDRRRASDLSRVGRVGRGAACVEPRNEALRQCASASAGYRIGAASIRTMFAGS